MIAPWLFERIVAWGDAPALVWSDTVTSYRELAKLADAWHEELSARQVGPGQVVAVEGNFSPNTCAALIALLRLGAVCVPLTPLLRSQREQFLDIAEARLLVVFDAADAYTFHEFPRTVTNAVTKKLIAREHAGLVIFSSGSTGKPKAILHDLVALLEKFHKPRRRKTTLTFLLFDHIGGIDTLFNALASGGTMVTVPTRDPEAVSRAIEKYRVHTLPTSPTFLNLWLISQLFEQYDFSSLKVIAYGTEPMPPSTLKKLHEILPDVALVQTYGMSELGVLRSRSRDSESLWIKFTGDGFRTKIIDHILWVKADAAMLGYLNAPDLIDEDGWLNTQDAVEVDGEYLRILGRVSDLINVGGQKVYPAEVENLLLQMDNVQDVAVFGRPHPMMGQVVSARFNLKSPEPLPDFKRRLGAFCRPRMAAYQTPRVVEISDDAQYGSRFKKLRSG